MEKIVHYLRIILVSFKCCLSLQSLSEDSSVPTSPRGKTLGKTKGKSFPGSKPWWAEDDDLKEPSVKDVVRKSWIKAKGSTKDTLRSVEDDILEEDEADGTLLTQVC